MGVDPLLEVKEVSKSFGGLVALNRVSFEVRQGDLCGLIGPNGAGKSVSVNIITGLYAPARGCVKYRKEDITGLRPDVIAGKGIRRTFQAATLFLDLPVIDNIRMGMRETTAARLLDAVFKTGPSRKEERLGRDRAEEILDFLNLGRYRRERAGGLPYGLQKVTSIGIALAGNPDLLILDEPLTGLVAAEAEEVMTCIESVNRKGVTVLVVEHNMRAVMRHCNRIVVLKFGERIAEGSPEEIQQNREVIESYLGE